MSDRLDLRLLRGSLLSVRRGRLTGGCVGPPARSSERRAPRSFDNGLWGAQGSELRTKGHGRFRRGCVCNGGNARSPELVSRRARPDRDFKDGLRRIHIRAGRTNARQNPRLERSCKSKNPKEPRSMFGACSVQPLLKGAPGADSRDGPRGRPPKPRRSRGGRPRASVKRRGSPFATLLEYPVRRAFGPVHKPDPRRSTRAVGPPESTASRRAIKACVPCMPWWVQGSRSWHVFVRMGATYRANSWGPKASAPRRARRRIKCAIRVAQKDAGLPCPARISTTPSARLAIKIRRPRPRVTLNACTTVAVAAVGLERKEWWRSRPGGLDGKTRRVALPVGNLGALILD